jgi:hypothetical protein
MRNERRLQAVALSFALLSGTGLGLTVKSAVNTNEEENQVHAAVNSQYPKVPLELLQEARSIIDNPLNTTGEDWLRARQIRAQEQQHKEELNNALGGHHLALKGGLITLLLFASGAIGSAGAYINSKRLRHEPLPFKFLR